MKILKLSRQKYQKNFFSLVLEGLDPAALKIHQDAVAQNDLKEGMDLDNTKLEAIQAFSLHQEALEFAYSVLKYRSLSESILKEKLKRKGFSHAVIEDAVRELLKNKLLNDERTAKDLAYDRLKNRKLGQERVREDLLKRGIDPETAEQALEGIQKEYAGEIPDEEERAYQSILKRVRQIKAEDSHTLYRKLFDYLSRRGFDQDTIEKAFSRYRREAGEIDKIESHNKDPEERSSPS